MLYFYTVKIVLKYFKFSVQQLLCCLVFSVKRKFFISFKHSEASLVRSFLLVFQRRDLGNEEGPAPLICLLISVCFDFLLILIYCSSNSRQNPAGIVRDHGIHLHGLYVVLNVVKVDSLIVLLKRCQSEE